MKIDKESQYLQEIADKTTESGWPNDNNCRLSRRPTADVKTTSITSLLLKDKDKDDEREVID